jgi:hypothetical protein
VNCLTKTKCGRTSQKSTNCVCLIFGFSRSTVFRKRSFDSCAVSCSGHAWDVCVLNDSERDSLRDHRARERKKERERERKKERERDGPDLEVLCVPLAQALRVNVEVDALDARVLALDLHRAQLVLLASASDIALPSAP